MKRTITSTISVVLSVVLLLCLASCGNKVDKEGLWENATYLKDTKLGKGEKTLEVEISAGGQSVTLTVKTDKTTVGEALLEHDIIAGEESTYGLYVKKVNGITADFDVDQRYWAFYVNGEYATSGVDTATITEGTTYKLEYTK